MRLSPIFNENKPYALLLSNCRFSNEKVEKVVKLPQNPTVKRDDRPEQDGK